jgi:hypothetical protein
MENGPREASGRTVRTGARDDKEMRERERTRREVTVTVERVAAGGAAFAGGLCRCGMRWEWDL